MNVQYLTRVRSFLKSKHMHYYPYTILCLLSLYLNKVIQSYNVSEFIYLAVWSLRCLLSVSAEMGFKGLFQVNLFLRIYMEVVTTYLSRLRETLLMRGRKICSYG